MNPAALEDMKATIRKWYRWSTQDTTLVDDLFAFYEGRIAELEAEVAAHDERMAFATAKWRSAQAEVERLTAERDRIKQDADAFLDTIAEQTREIKRLRAVVGGDDPILDENERLREERDELLARLGRMEGEYLAAPKMILDRDREIERLRAKRCPMCGWPAARTPLRTEEA